MKVLIIISALIATAITFVRSQDISMLLSNRYYMEKQINCILDRGYCDMIGKQIVGLLPEVVNNHCQLCTPRQADHARTLVTFMQRYYPNEWSLIVRRYTAVPHRLIADEQLPRTINNSERR